MLNRKSGFIQVLAIVLGVLVLGVAAYTLKNAGTSKDPVAMVASVFDGSGLPRNPYSYTYGNPPCPKKCEAAFKAIGAAEKAYEKARLAMEKCRQKYQAVGGVLENCARQQAALDKAWRAANDAPMNYNKCINKEKAWKSCPNSAFPPYSWNTNDPNLQCAKLEADLEDARQTLLKRIDFYNTCMANPGYMGYSTCAYPYGGEYENKLLLLGFYCSDSAKDKPSSDVIIKGGITKNKAR